jgi:GNAT superfamily N-acetyltransferase
MTTPMPIFAVETMVSADEFRTLLLASGLGVRRPLGDLVRLDAMLRNANVVLTARVDGVLVGMARAVTDFVFCCYLSDLVVHENAQRQGIGARLIEEVRQHLGPGVSIILNSVPESVGFYERSTLSPLPNCFWHRREQ